MGSIETFTVHVPQPTLDHLQERLRQTRWTDEIDDGWTFGTDRAELRALVDYWMGPFDWRRQEESINRFAQFHATVDGVGLHFVHERGVGEHPLPIILTPARRRHQAFLPSVATTRDARGSAPHRDDDALIPSLRR
jgi:microsomal epoxide hydrolase